MYDHLVPFANTIGATVLVYSNEDETAIRLYYPETNLVRIHTDATMYSQICDHADLLITSTSQTGDCLQEGLRSFCHKEIPYMFLPHGQSDKGYTNQNIATTCPHRFVYGQYMIDQLREQNIETESTIVTGNFRLDYYEKHRDFFDCKVPQKENTLLYAPTWMDCEGSSSVSRGLETLEELADHFNVFVKLHPHTLKHAPAYFYALEAKADLLPTVHFIREMPCIYPLLQASSMYLGDYSSVGYDFLAFNRPMYFFAPEEAIKSAKSNALFSCGEIIPQGTSPAAFIKASSQKHLSSMRQERYAYAFAQQATPKEDLYNRMATDSIS